MIAIRKRQQAESVFTAVPTSAPVSVSSAPVTNTNNDGLENMSARARAAEIARRAAEAEAKRKPTAYEAVFGSADYRRGQAYRDAYREATTAEGPFNLGDIAEFEDEWMRRYPDNPSGIDPGDINPGYDEL